MPVEVDFITLGDASEKLSTPEKRVPPATLRHWTEQLEEFDTHYVLRNNRNERIYYEEDLKVFEFLRDLKEEYGRRTTSRDLAYMLVDKHDAGEIKLRQKEDAPLPSNPSNRTAELLGQEDIKRLMESDRVKQFMGIISTNVKDELSKQFESEFMKVNKEIVASHERIEEAIKEQNKKWEEKMEAREKQTNEYIQELRKKREAKWWQIWK